MGMQSRLGKLFTIVNNVKDDIVMKKSGHDPAGHEIRKYAYNNGKNEFQIVKKDEIHVVNFYEKLKCCLLHLTISHRKNEKGFNIHSKEYNEKTGKNNKRRDYGHIKKKYLKKIKSHKFIQKKFSYIKTNYKVQYMPNLKIEKYALDKYVDKLIVGDALPPDKYKRCSSKKIFIVSTHDGLSYGFMKKIGEWFYIMPLEESLLIQSKISKIDMIKMVCDEMDNLSDPHAIHSIIPQG